MHGVTFSCIVHLCPVSSVYVQCTHLLKHNLFFALKYIHNKHTGGHTHTQNLNFTQLSQEQPWKFWVITARLQTETDVPTYPHSYACMHIHIDLQCTLTTFASLSHLGSAVVSVYPPLTQLCTPSNSINIFWGSNAQVLEVTITQD